MSSYYKTFKKISYYEINEKKIIYNYNVLFDRITVSSGFSKKLNENEAHFMLAHEAGHRKDRGLFLFFILLCFFNTVLFFISSIISFFIDIEIEFLLTFFLFTAVSFLFLICFYRYSEYRADEYAANQVSYKHFINAVEKFKQENYSILIRFFAKLTHPSPENRIKHITTQIKKNT
jgi:Zn-dependent protease with chaperone function